MSAPADLPYDLEEVRTLLNKAGLVARDDAFSLAPYEPAFPRRPANQRHHYRVENAEKPICHLIVGLNLEPVRIHAEKFSQLCPALICRPLAFWKRADGMSYLCLEHFAGESLEVLVQDGRCDSIEWVRIVRKAQQLLESSESPSNQDRLIGEIRALAESVCAFPGFSGVDIRLVRELAVSILLQQVAFNPPTTRWSNGDFIGRNLLVNAQGDIRLIDYEHAGPTHFWRSDWLRLTQFSQLPPGLDLAEIEEISRVQQPWQKVHFWLYNLSQLSEAEPGERVDRYIRSVVREVFKAIDAATKHTEAAKEASFLLAALAMTDAASDIFATTPRDEQHRQQRLQEDLEQARYQLLSLAREVAQKNAAIRDHAGTNHQLKAEVTSLTFESRRLRDTLFQAQSHIDQLLKQHSTAKPTNRFALEIVPPPGVAGSFIAPQEVLFAAKGRLIVAGWITGISTGSQIRLRFDGGHIFDCASENQSVPGISEGLSSSEGKRVNFSLNTYVPAGLHLVTLEYRASGSDSWTSLCTRSLVAEIGPPLLRLEIAIPPTGAHGDYTIQGWCFHPQEKIKSISVRRGSIAANLTHRTARSDVAASYPWSGEALLSGFSGSLEFSPGDADVVLSASLESGAVLHEIIARRILVQDDALKMANESLGKQSLARVFATTLPICRLNEVLSFGKDDTIRPFLEFGWYEPEHGLRWAMGLRAGLRFRFHPDERPSSMKVTVIPLIVAGKAERQRIQIDLPHNTEPGSLELTASQAQELTFHFRIADFESDVLGVRFGFPDASRPHDLGLSNDSRVLSVAFVKLMFA